MLRRRSIPPAARRFATVDPLDEDWTNPDPEEPGNAKGWSSISIERGSAEAGVVRAATR